MNFLDLYCYFQSPIPSYFEKVLLHFNQRLMYCLFLLLRNQFKFQNIFFYSYQLHSFQRKALLSYFFIFLLKYFFKHLCSIISSHAMIIQYCNLFLFANFFYFHTFYIGFHFHLANNFLQLLFPNFIKDEKRYFHLINLFLLSYFLNPRTQRPIFIYNIYIINILKMNSQSNQSEIAQQNCSPLLPMLPDINNQNTANKYMTYHEIKQYQSSRNDVAQGFHQNCHPINVQWIKQNSSNYDRSPIVKTSDFSYFIDYPICQRCFLLRFLLNFNLKKRSKIQLVKVKKINNLSVQQDIKYTIQHNMVSIKIQVSITKQKVTKIWKQMQMPIKSYETQTMHNLILQQASNGNIIINFNDFQFTLNLTMISKCQYYFEIRTQNKINKIQFQLTQINQVQDKGCSEDKCIIF